MRTRTAILMILVAVALISVGIGVRHGDGGGRTDAHDGRTVPSAPVDTLVVMEILNGTGLEGLARDVGLALGSVGATAERFANAPHDTFPACLLINRSLPDRRAGDLARALGDLPLLQEFVDGAVVDAVLLLGADYERVLASLDVRRSER